MQDTKSFHVFEIPVDGKILVVKVLYQHEQVSPIGWVWKNEDVNNG